MIYFDLETTANGGPDGTSPDAHWSVNKVLLCGWSMGGGHVYVNKDMTTLAEQIQDDVNKKGIATIVAHNAKFDIKYLMRDHPELPWECINVWDTMTWEYLDSGHRTTMASLEEVAAKYGIKFNKSLDLGALLSKGIKMEDIDEGQLKDYLIEDVQVLIDIKRNQKGTYWMNYLLP